MPDNQDWIDDLYAEGAKETPPPELDEKIRAAAQQPVRHQWYRSPGRLAMLATAASLVIAVSVIFFEPGQTPAEAPRKEQIDPSAAIMTDATGDELGKAEVAEEEMALTRQVSNTPAAAPVLRSQRPQSERPVEATDARDMTPDLNEQRLEEYVASGAMRQSAGALEASPADLEALCGALPGTDETREISTDGEGILVTVTVGEDVRSWRCLDGAWIELPSEE